MEASHLALLEKFTELLKSKPEMVHDPKLKFFKDYLLSLGANLPAEPAKDSDRPKFTAPQPKPAEPESEDEESDIDLDMTGVIEEEEYDPIELPPLTDDEIPEEKMDESNDARSAGMRALSDGNLEEALKQFTTAIRLNPRAAPALAKRAQVLVKLNKPSAAVKDCERAIDINPDSAAAFMWRGRAHQLLGDFEASWRDFTSSSKIDDNEVLEEWMKAIKPNVDKIQAHKAKMDRKKKEREEKARKARIEKAREEQRRAAEEQRRREEEGAAGGGFPGGMPGGFPGGMPGGFPGGMPGGFPGGMGGMPGGMGGGMPGGMNFADIFNDPEIMTAMQDPEVMAAFTDVQKNPANISKYDNNEKVQKVLNRLSTKFGGMGGAAGGAPGGGGADDLD